MSEEVGNLSFGDPNSTDFLRWKPYSEKLATSIDAEVNRLVSEAYTRTKALLQKHVQEVEKVAGALLEKEKLDKEGLISLLGPRPFEEQLTYDDLVKDTGKQHSSFMN